MPTGHKLHQQPASSPSAVVANARPTRVRHAVLWLTVSAYMITYMDRVVISSAVPAIQTEFEFDLPTIGWILAAFRWGYALFQIPGGWLGDRIGPRRAMTLIVILWSVFTSLTAAAWNAASMLVSRFLFGVGEAGAFSIATRSLSRWILPADRGFAQGVTHAGARLGAAVTPPLVVGLMAAGGWRAPFLVFGLLGIGWAAFWFWFYRDTPGEHRRANAAERTLIQAALKSKPPAASNSVPWRSLLANPTLRYLSVMYFCYCYCIAVYLDWFPTYLKDHFGLSLRTMGFYAMLPLLAGTVGDLLGGWLSDRLFAWTGNLRQARRGVAVCGFLLAAAAIVPAALIGDALASVLFSSLAVFGLELTVGVSWAIPLDIAGDYAGSAASIMNTCGNIGAAISPVLLAYLVRSYGWDTPFLVASVACAVAALLYFKIDAGRHMLAE